MKGVHTNFNSSVTLLALFSFQSMRTPDIGHIFRIVAVIAIMFI